MAIKTRIMSAKALATKKFVEVAVTGVWQERLGNLERNFRMCVYGPSTSGKSTLVLDFSRYLSDELKRKGLYNSHEERQNKTFQIRLFETKANETALLYIADAMPFDELMERIGKLKYHYIVIDSILFMHLTYDQFVQMVQKYKHKAFIFIGHGEALGSFDNGHIKAINKACDIKVFMAYGQATIASRYKGGVQTYKLFDYVPPKPLKASPQIPLL